jgi:hypothetical protein
MGHQQGDTQMTTKTYKSHRIDRNMNGKWIVTYPDNRHTQHNTLADAKEAINFAIDAADDPR